MWSLSLSSFSEKEITEFYNQPGPYLTDMSIQILVLPHRIGRTVNFLNNSDVFNGQPLLKSCQENGGDLARQLLGVNTALKAQKVNSSHSLVNEHNIATFLSLNTVSS